MPPHRCRQFPGGGNQAIPPQDRFSVSTATKGVCLVLFLAFSGTCQVPFRPAREIGGPADYLRLRYCPFSSLLPALKSGRLWYRFSWLPLFLSCFMLILWREESMRCRLFHAALLSCKCFILKAISGIWAIKKAGRTSKPLSGVHNCLWTKVIPAILDGTCKITDSARVLLPIMQKSADHCPKEHNDTTGTNTIFTTCAMRHLFPLTAKRLYLPKGMRTKINHKISAIYGICQDICTRYSSYVWYVFPYSG